MFTGKEPNAEPDPDAHFFVHLVGSRGDSGSRWLYKSRSKDEWFVSNQMDEFELEAVSLGDVREIKIGHDVADTGAV